MSATVDHVDAEPHPAARDGPDGDARPLDVLVYTPVPLVRAGLRATLRGAAEDVRLVGETTTLDRVHELCEKLRPDVLLLDMTAGARNPESLEQLGSLRRLLTPTRLLVMVDPDARAYVGRILAHRVAGVICRDAQPAEITVAVEQVGRGNAVFDVAQRMRPQQAAPGLSVAARVTPREIEVLQLMARGFGTQAIGCELHIAASTVKFHLRQLTHKLGTGTRASLVYRAVQRGILPLTLRAAAEPSRLTPTGR